MRVSGKFPNETGHPDIATKGFLGNCGRRNRGARSAHVPGQAQLPPVGLRANTEEQRSAQVPWRAGGHGNTASTGVIVCVDGPAVVVSLLDRGHYTPGLHLELGRCSVWEGARQACARVPAVQKTDSAHGRGAPLAAAVQ